MTILEKAQLGEISDEMALVADLERINPQNVVNSISKGRAVIMTRTGFNPIGIGHVFRTKINVNLGTSTSVINFEDELEKLKVATEYGADTISDLSMGGKIDEIRKKILNNSSIPITTVPIYQTVMEAGSLGSISEDLMINVIRKQVNDGISSVVIHAGFTLEDLRGMKGKRIMGMVSKGGSLTASIMAENSVENPYYNHFDAILEILYEKEVVLNLGNAMRSGCIHDQVDKFQLAEMKLNAKLAKRANKKGIQVIIESLGGHVNAKELEKWIKIHKRITGKRPLFVSGPIPTDFAPGYDHIAAAIGGAFASGYGADYICAITPAEHLCLPTVEDIKRGLISSRIAAHVGDSIKFGLNHLFNDDLEIAKNRFLKDWSKQFAHGIDPEEPAKKHPIDEKQCSMCGNYCSLSLSKRIFKLTQ